MHGVMKDGNFYWDLAFIPSLPGNCAWICRRADESQDCRLGHESNRTANRDSWLNQALVFKNHFGTPLGCERETEDLTPNAERDDVEALWQQ